MVDQLVLKGEITEDGRLIVELPPDAPRGPVTIRLEADRVEISIQAAADLELEALLTDAALQGMGLDAADIARAPEIGAWRDSPIEDSAAYVEALRERLKQRYRW